MNERIKELWEEGTMSSWPRAGKFTAGEYDYNLEKFAALIVQECFTILTPYIDDTGIYYVEKELKEYFGIEE